jgi:hypothetical protein
MVVLRRTQKLARSLPASRSTPLPSDTALGDWYVNRLSIDRRPLLLLVSSRGLLSVLIPARKVATLPERLPEVVDSRLRRLGIPQSVVQAEVAAMESVTVAATEDRSVVGIMVDFAKSIPYYLDAGAWDDSSLPFVEARLAETPCHASRRFEEVVFPKRKASELLCARWVPANTR